MVATKYRIPHTPIEQMLAKRLERLVTYYKKFAHTGKSATYIPALAQIDPNQLGISITGASGTTVHAGDWNVQMTLQSISKVMSFIVVCMHKEMNEVMKKVDVEPTGDAFNSIVRLEANESGKPFNPMINAGAITVTSMLPGKTNELKLESILSLLTDMLGRRPLINDEIYQSENAVGYRNRAIAYYLKETGFLETEVEEALEVYFKQCAIEIDTVDLAVIGLVLALDGYHPIKKCQIIPRKVAKLAKALMITCGMYNTSGKHAAFIGIPAKSGVSGGIMAVISPRQRSLDHPFQDGCGIGIFGPAIDSVGNSVAGVMLLRHLSQEYDLSIF